MRTHSALCLVFASQLMGCATYQTLNYTEGGYFSGTRYNLALLQNDADSLSRYERCSAPRYPLVDLPLSFAADSVVTFLQLFADKRATFNSLRPFNQP